MVEASARPILEVDGVSAGYGARRIVGEISLCLRPGDIVGLLGANGSGKSTLIKAITGQIRLMNGSVAIEGVDLKRDPEMAKAGFGLAVDSNQLPMRLTGRQYLQLVASIRRCAADFWPCGDLTERLSFRPWLDRMIGAYSLGTRAKLSIAAALLGAPALVILDESLNGLDPLAAWEVKTILRELAATGRRACLVATHLVESVPSLCNRALFLHDGADLRSWDKPALAQCANSPGAFEAEVIALLKARLAGERASA